MLEVIGAIFILTVGIGAAFSLISQTLSTASLAKEKLIASYLVQEGIEIIRNMRDGNFLEGEAWDEGLTNCSGGCIVDYNHSYGPNQEDPNLPAYSGQYLNIDSNGFYSHSSGIQTNFQRKVTITEPEANTLRILSEVFWQEKGRTHSFKAMEELRNWK